MVFPAVLSRDPSLSFCCLFTEIRHEISIVSTFITAFFGKNIDKNVNFIDLDQVFLVDEVDFFFANKFFGALPETKFNCYSAYRAPFWSLHESPKIGFGLR